MLSVDYDMRIQGAIAKGSALLALVVGLLWSTFSLLFCKSSQFIKYHFAATRLHTVFICACFTVPRSIMLHRNESNWPYQNPPWIQCFKRTYPSGTISMACNSSGWFNPEEVRSASFHSIGPTLKSNGLLPSQWTVKNGSLSMPV